MLFPATSGCTAPRPARAIGDPLDALTLLLVLFSALLHAAWSAFMKGSRDTMAFNVVQTLPTAIATLALLPFLGLGAIPRDVWLAAAASGAIHGIYFLWLTRALELGELSAVYPIIRATPALTALTAAPLLGERISPAGGLGIATVVIGVWAVQTGGSLRLERFRGRGMRFAYLALLSTVAYSLVDKAGMNAFEPVAWSAPVPRSLVFYVLISNLMLLTFLPFALRRTTRDSLVRCAREEWRTVLLATGATLASYGLILEAFRSAEVSYVVAVRQSSVLFALALGATWLRERPDRPRVLGALATVLGVALIALGG